MAVLHVRGRFARCLELAAAIIMVTLVSLTAANAQLDADSAVGLYAGALDEIKAVEAEYLLSITDDTPGAKKDDNGRSILFQYDWHFRKEGSWQFYDGEIGFIHRGKWHYHGQVFSWDGEDFIAYHRGQKSALINASPWEVFQHYKSPMVMLGDSLFGDFSMTTLDVLELGNNLEVIESNETQIVITTTFDWALRPNEEDNTHVSLTLDPSHGNLAKEILITSLITGTPIVHLLVDDYEQLPHGVWFPTRGQLTNYRTERVDKPGQEAAFKATPDGVGTMFLRVKPRSLAVNKVLHKEDFQVTLPRDVTWWDERTNESFEPERPPESTGPSLFWSMNVAALAVLAIGFAVRSWWRSK